MYIIYKKELQGVGFEYKIDTTFGDSLLLIQHLDGIYEIFFLDNQKELASILLDSNEAKIFSQLLNPESLM